MSGFFLYQKKDGVTMLNVRQKRFAEYYAQSGNASDSARKAGYSAKYINSDVQKLLQNTAISDYIKELTEKAKDERIMTARDRQVLLSDIARSEVNEVADRIRAVDTLNKMTGEYTLKLNATVRPSEKLSDILSQIGSGGLSE